MSRAAMRIHKLILDTNVCWKLLTSAYRADIDEIQDRIKRDFRVVVSPQTFLELLDGIKGGDGSHFEADKAKFRLMAGNGKPDFLRFPGIFALSKAIGVVPRENPSVSHLGPRSPVPPETSIGPQGSQPECLFRVVAFGVCAEQLLLEHLPEVREQVRSSLFKM